MRFPLAIPLLAGLTALLIAPAASAEPRARDHPAVAASITAAQEALDACGGRGLLDSAIPNGIFLQACRHHDACYRSGVLDQGRCDADFLYDMRAACTAHYPGPDTALLHATCQAGAYTYYRAVNSRVGAMLYPWGVTGGRMLAPELTRRTRGSAPAQLTVCAEAMNTANRKLRYRLVLRDARGQPVTLGPVVKRAGLQPGETRRLCAGTGLNPLVSAEGLGEVFAVTLEVADPDDLNPLGTPLTVDRFDCDTATGACARVPV